MASYVGQFLSKATVFPSIFFVQALPELRRYDVVAKTPATARLLSDNGGETMPELSEEQGDETELCA
jgi:hypothetical protein